MVNELTAAELKDLLNTFESDKRKLSYRLQQIDRTISDLQRMIDRFGTGNLPEPSFSEPEEQEAQTEVTAEAPKAAPVAPSNNEAKEELPASAPKRGRRSRITQAPADSTPPATLKRKSPKKSKKAKGYRLSEWDTALMEGLKKAKHPLINQELYQLLEDKNQQEQHGLDEKDIRGKLNRSLHKLANKREELIKVDYEGKGFAYALRRWVTPEGQLKDKFEREAA